MIRKVDEYGDQHRAFVQGKYLNFSVYPLVRIGCQASGNILVKIIRIEFYDTCPTNHSRNGMFNCLMFQE